MKESNSSEAYLLLSEAREKVVQLEFKAQQILNEGKDLAAKFKRIFSGGKPALRFGRYRDRSLVIYRWRSYGEGSKPVDLISEEGKKILMNQDPAVRKVWLDFENDRQRLNLEYGIIEYQRKKLKAWIEQQERLELAIQEAKI